MKRLALLLLSGAVSAQELSFKTEVGEVVITDEKCKIEWQAAGNGLDYHAYATDTEISPQDHLGCWTVDEETVHIYWPEIEELTSYRTRLFQAR